MKNRLFVLVCAILVGGCTTGPLDVHEVHYYKASNGTDANYFRLTVDAHTRLGNAEYRSGWFPARSVDSLFGEVTGDSESKTIQVRESIQQLINTNVYITTKKWLDAAVTNASSAELDSINAARRNVLAYPELRPDPGMTIMDCNPISGLIKEHSDEKFVILLSSNPDEIVGKIAAFTEQEKTSATIQKLSSTLIRAHSDEVSAMSATENERKSLDVALATAIDSATNSIKIDPTKTDEAIEQIQLLMSLLNATKQ